MEPRRHTIKSFDGTRIYYEVYGKGPAICACNGIGVTTCFWPYLVDHFAKDHTVILWDYRFHGQSGPGPSYHNLTMATNARDCLAVLDHVGVDQALLTGHSMGVQTIFEFYRLFPDRVAGLVPVLGAYGKPMNTFMGTSLMAHIFPLAYHTVYMFPRLTRYATRTAYKGLFLLPVAFHGGSLTGFIDGHHFNRKDLAPYLDHLKGLDMRAFLGMAKRMQEHSAEDLLPNIKVPVLVVSGEKDLFTPWGISREMANEIPGAELLTIPKGSHAALVEQPELMNLRIEKFIRERFAGSAWKNGKAGKVPVKKAS